VGELSCSFVTSGSHLTAGRVFDANQSGWTSRNIVNKPEKSNMALGAECRLNPRRLPVIFRCVLLSWLFLENFTYETHNSCDNLHKIRQLSSQRTI